MKEMYGHLDSSDNMENIISREQIDKSGKSLVELYEEGILGMISGHDNFGKLHVHIDLESVAEADGVTEPQNTKEFSMLTSKSAQFSTLEMCEIVQLSVKQLGREKFGGVSISDFNPILEDQRTGRCVGQIFYQMCLGICQNKIGK